VLEIADATLHRAREAAFLVTEEFGFDEVVRNRAAVHGDERGVAPGAVIVDRARDEFLAGAGFADDERGGVGGGHAFDLRIQFQHHRGRAVQKSVGLQARHFSRAAFFVRRRIARGDGRRVQFG
jgi:hypothetical protein